MDEVKAYRFPTISTSQHGNAEHHTIHIQPRPSKVSSCVIDSPRDDVRRYREHLLTFQKQNRGVKGQGGSLPNIPFRLRSHATSADFQSEAKSASSDVGFPVLENYMNNAFADTSLLGHFTRTRTSLSATLSDTVTPDALVPSLGTKGINMPFAKSLRLFSREIKQNGRLGAGSVSDRLPLVNNQNEDITSPLKKSNTLFDVYDGENERTITTGNNVEGRNLAVDIHSNRIGHTTNASVDTRKTLADVLNRRNVKAKHHTIDKGKSEFGYSDVHSKQTFNPETIPDRYWVQRFDTKVVDINSYDSFARTRKPDSDVSNKTDPKAAKRPRTQRSSYLDQITLMSVAQKDESYTKKSERKYSKLRIALTNSNNRSAE